MSVSITLHRIKDIEAYCYADCGSITFELQGDSVTHHLVSLFTDDPILNQRLVEAINAIATQRREEKNLAQEVTS